MASGVFLAPTAAENKYVIPQTIYHYTSPDGMIGIIINNELWFSRFDCLNDIDEGKYILNPFRKAIEELRGIIDDSFLKEIAELEPDFKHYFRKGSIQYNGDTTSYNIENIESIPYLCCFSTNKDSLPMWNYYSKNGRYEGFNIGFDWNQIKDNSEALEACCVIYKLEDQIEILKNHINESYINYIEHNHPLGFIQMGMTRVLSTRGMQFKNPAYIHEEEVRLIYWRPERDSTIAVKAPQLYYRQKQGIIIPYLKIHNINSSVRSVMIGPIIKMDVAEKTLNCMMNNNGLAVEIEQSTIPIRY